MESKRLHVLYCGDAGIYKGIYLSVLSILMRSPGEVFTFHLITMKVIYKNQERKALSEEDRSDLEILAKSFNPDNEVKLYDATSIYERTLTKSRNHLNAYTPYTLLRLFSLEFIEDDVERLLYIDADTMAVRNPSLFYEEYDIEGKELAAGPDYLGRFYIRPNYFNAGVIYLNPRKLRETRLFENAIELLGRKKYYFPDQSALNDLVKDRIKLSMKYNEQRRIKKDTVIAHFPKRIGLFYDPIKPWDIYRVRHMLKFNQFDDVYRVYLERYPFERRGEQKPPLDVLD